MMKKTKIQFGYFLLADISGFTAYLVGVELEHAGDILKELLEYVTGQIQPVFAVQDYHIDSVFAYAPTSGLDEFGVIYNLIESTYTAFKNRLQTMSSSITCACAACRNVTSLDLKFMVHHGEYVISNVRGQYAFLGQAPTFVRNRGWKESVSASVGWCGYVLFTEPCLASLHVSADEFQGEKFDYDHFRMFGLELKSEGE